MLNRARLFDPYEYGETFLDADMAIKQRQLPSPLDATHHIHLIDCDWEKISSFDDNIATIRKWVQVMVFGADESESDDELGDQDRELAYREEEAEIYREEEAEIEEHAHVCLLRDGAGLNVGRHLPHSEERPVPVSACRRTGRAESPRAYERGGVDVYQRPA